MEIQYTGNGESKIITRHQEHEEVLQSFQLSYHTELHQSQKVDDTH